MHTKQQTRLEQTPPCRGNPSISRQQGKDLAKKHGIIGYPTVLLLDSNGEQVGVLRGVVPLPSLEKALDGLLQEEP